MDLKEKDAKERVEKVLSMISEIEKDIDKLKENVDGLKEYLLNTSAIDIIGNEDEPRLDLESGLKHISIR